MGIFYGTIDNEIDHGVMDVFFLFTKKVEYLEDKFLDTYHMTRVRFRCPLRLKYTPSA